MEHQSLSRKLSQVGKNNISQDRVGRKKIATFAKEHHNEMAGSKTLSENGSPKQLIQLVSLPSKEDDGKSDSFSAVMKTTLQNNGKEKPRMRRLSQAGISSCSEEYRTILQDLKDIEDTKKNVSKNVSKQEKRRLARAGRKISCTATFARGKLKKSSISTFHSPKAKEATEFRLDPVSRSRLFTVPAVQESVTTKSLPTPLTKPTKMAWPAKEASSFYGTKENRAHEKRRHVSLPCPPKGFSLENNPTQESKKLAVKYSHKPFLTDFNTRASLITDIYKPGETRPTRKISVVHSNRTRRDASLEANLEALTDNPSSTSVAHIVYEKIIPRSRSSTSSSVLRMKPNFRSVGIAAIAAKRLIGNHYRQNGYDKRVGSRNIKSMDELFEEMKNCRYIRVRGESSFFVDQDSLEKLASLTLGTNQNE